MRKRLYNIIDAGNSDNKLSVIYDTFMMFIIIISLIPLAFKTSNTFFSVIETVSTIVFIIDYLLRLITADHALKTKLPAAVIIYPFTPMAVIDLIVILSSFTFLSNGFRILKILRLLIPVRVTTIFGSEMTYLRRFGVFFFPHDPLLAHYSNEQL